MDIRGIVKQFLRVIGHALTSALHERMGYLEQQLREVSAQNVNIAQNQAAMLDASIHAVEMLQQLDQQARNQAAALDSIRRQANWIPEPAGSLVTSPEAGLMEFLYSYLPERKAIDIGAHIGDISEHLLNAGYEVYAFEPNPPVYDRLVQRLGQRKGFRGFPFAVGWEEGDRTLHLAEDRSGFNRYNDATLFSSLTAHQMPDDIAFVGSIQVPVRNLAALHHDQLVPADIGLAKIDAEGHDLEVIRGMGDCRYPVVVAEYWDRETPIAGPGLRYTLGDLVAEMRGRGYAWHIVMYQIWMGSQHGFYSNYSRPVPNSWGNVFFFRDYRIFSEAQNWCSAVLPQTYFKPVPKAEP